MNDYDFRILSFQSQMEENKSTSKKIKGLAFVCLFFSFCYALPADYIGTASKSDLYVRYVVWILALLGIVGSFVMESRKVKQNKALEWEIFRLEKEKHQARVEIAEITGEPLTDYILNQQIDEPKNEIILPIGYYSVLLILNVFVWLFLII